MVVCLSGLFFVGTHSARAATCVTSTCTQIETMRQNYNAGRYSFSIPSWGVAVGSYLTALDNAIAYMDSVRKYYPTQASWDTTVEAIRRNYLFSFNSFLTVATLLPEEEPEEEVVADVVADNEEENAADEGEGGAEADDGGGDELVGGGAAATKRIILTLSNGNKYAWRYSPPANGQAASLVSEGQVE